MGIVATEHPRLLGSWRFLPGAQVHGRNLDSGAHVTGVVEPYAGGGRLPSVAVRLAPYTLLSGQDVGAYAWWPPEACPQERNEAAA